MENLLPYMQEESFGPNDAIITEGELNDKVYFIIEGQVSVTKGEFLLARFGEGDAFGEMEVLDVMPAVASIKALTDVSLMSVSNKSMREIYKMDVRTFSLMIMNLARDLSRRLRKMDEKLAASPILF